MDVIYLYFRKDFGKVSNINLKGQSLMKRCQCFDLNLLDVNPGKRQEIILS